MRKHCLLILCLLLALGLRGQERLVVETGRTMELDSLGESYGRMMVRVESGATLVVRHHVRLNYLHLDLMPHATLRFEHPVFIGRGVLNLHDSSRLDYPPYELKLGSVYLYNGQGREGGEVKVPLHYRLVHPYEADRLHWYNQGGVVIDRPTVAPTVGVACLTAPSADSPRETFLSEIGCMAEVDLLWQRRWCNAPGNSVFRSRSVGMGLLVEHHQGHPFNMWVTLPILYEVRPWREVGITVGIIPGVLVRESKTSHYGAHDWRFDLALGATVHGVRLPQLRYDLRSFKHNNNLFHPNHSLSLTYTWIF